MNYIKTLFLSILLMLIVVGKAYAFQEEGYFLNASLGIMSDSLGQNTTLSQSFWMPVTYQNTTKMSFNPFYMLGGGRSINLTNSINWQLGLYYFQVNDTDVSGNIIYGNSNNGSYEYKLKSQGYWFGNTFHFDLFAGNLTSLQPYVSILLGVAKNSAVEFEANTIPKIQPAKFSNNDMTNFAFGGVLGLSYQLADWQVLSLGLNYWHLGNAHTGNFVSVEPGLPSSDRLNAGAVTMLGVALTYHLQF